MYRLTFDTAEYTRAGGACSALGRTGARGTVDPDHPEMSDPHGLLKVPQSWQHRWLHNRDKNDP